MLRLYVNSAEWDSRLGQLDMQDIPYISIYLYIEIDRYRYTRYTGSCFSYISTIDLYYINLDFTKILLDADGNRVEAVYRDLLFHERLYFFPLQTLRSIV